MFPKINKKCEISQQVFLFNFYLNLIVLLLICINRMSRIIIYAIVGRGEPYRAHHH